MYPIIWLPMLDPSPDSYEPSRLITNKGTYALYQSDITFRGYVMDGRTFIGWCPTFYSTTSSLSFMISSELGDKFQKGFGITVTIRAVSIDNRGTIFKFFNSNRLIEIGINDVGVYLKNGGPTASEQNMPELANIFDPSNSDDTGSHSFAFSFTGKELLLFVDGVQVYSNACYYTSTGVFNTFMAGGMSNFQLMNLKIYDSPLSVKQIRDDHIMIGAHYIFDDSSSDDATYDIAYDCSGIGPDIQCEGGFTLSSTFSPSRQWSSVINKDVSINVGSVFHMIAWVNLLSSDMACPFKLLTNHPREVVVFNPVDVFPSINKWYFVQIQIDSITKAYVMKMIDLNGNEISMESSAVYGDTVTAIPSHKVMELAISPNIAISDLRVYYQNLDESEISFLYNRNVHIDDRGTLHATELQDVDHMTTFSFGDRGQISAPSFTDTKNIGEKGVMEYDYLNGVMNVRDFKEV